MASQNGRRPGYLRSANQNHQNFPEDDENARETREKNLGDIPYSAVASSYKFECDGDFVKENKPRVAREAEQLVVS